MATIKKITALRKLCARYDLEDRTLLKKYTNSKLAADIYNGAGPDSWIPLARDVLTSMMSLFEPAVLIHDAQFYESDGTRETFERTVKLWKRNFRRIFDFEYPLLTRRILNGNYRAERAYWYGIMQAGIIGISGDPAFNAWKDAFVKRKGLIK